MDLAGEPVDGDDRRRVELGERDAEAPEARAVLVVRHQQLQELVVLGRFALLARRRQPG